MWKVIWVFISILIISACSSNTIAKQPEAQRENAMLVPVPITASILTASDSMEEDAGMDECLSRGGKWVAMYQDGSKGCDLAYPDAGKPCSDNAQCASNACLTEQVSTAALGGVTGWCASSSKQKLNSCMNNVVSGRVVLQTCR